MVGLLEKKIWRFTDIVFVMQSMFTLILVCITLNFLIKAYDPEHQRATEEQINSFRTDLETHIDLIRKYKRVPMFTNTTPNPEKAGMRNDKDVVILNEIATEVTNSKSVPYNDIYSFVKKQNNYHELYMHPHARNNCHFNETGRKILGEEIAKFVNENI